MKDFSLLRNCFRQIRLENREHFKLTAQKIKDTQLVSLHFIGLKEIRGDRVPLVLANPKLKQHVRVYVFDVDSRALQIVGGSEPRELRVVMRSLAEPLNQNEPSDLPEGDAESEALAAMYIEEAVHQGDEEERLPEDGAIVSDVEERSQCQIEDVGTEFPADDNVLKELEQTEFLVIEQNNREQI